MIPRKSLLYIFIQLLHYYVFQCFLHVIKGVAVSVNTLGWNEIRSRSSVSPVYWWHAMLLLAMWNATWSCESSLLLAVLLAWSQWPFMAFCWLFKWSADTWSVLNECSTKHIFFPIYYLVHQPGEFLLPFRPERSIFQYFNFFSGGAAAVVTSGSEPEVSSLSLTIVGLDLFAFMK